VHVGLYAVLVTKYLREGRITWLASDLLLESVKDRIEASKTLKRNI
jgi:hypothetical protein